MEMQAAICSLALVTAKKLTGQHTNGDVEDAMEQAKAAQEEYADFVRDKRVLSFLFADNSQTLYRIVKHPFQKSGIIPMQPRNT